MNTNPTDTNTNNLNQNRPQGNFNYADKNMNMENQQNHLRDARLSGFERKSHEHNTAQRATEQAAKTLNTAARSKIPMALGVIGLGALAYAYWPKMSRPRHETMHAANEVMHSTREGLHDIAKQSKDFRKSLDDDVRASSQRK